MSNGSNPLNPSWSYSSVGGKTYMTAAENPAANVTLNTGQKVSSVLTAISGFINSTFPYVWATVKGQAVATMTTTTTPTAQKTSGITPDQLREVLLVAGVAVLGVALALALFRKKPVK